MNGSDDARAKDQYWRARERHWFRHGIRRPDGTPFTRADYDALWTYQMGVCALCGLPLYNETHTAPVNVDHAGRGAGPVRGLLHPLCNRKIGDITPQDALRIRLYLMDPPARRLYDKGFDKASIRVA